MRYKTRAAALLLAVTAAVAALQLPAVAHHREGHEGGRPAPTASPTPTPTSTPTPTPGDQPAMPCVMAGPVENGGRLSCTAVSNDGTMEVNGTVEAAPFLSCGGGDIFHGGGCQLDYTGSFLVGIDTGSGPQWICARGIWSGVATCGGSVAVPSGTPVECVIWAWADLPPALAELSCV